MAGTGSARSSRRTWPISTELGCCACPTPKPAFSELYGLVVRDTQIRVLIGEPPPSTAAQRRQADAGVDRFWQAYQSDQ